uniref:Retrotransposon protein, putative, Ty3-gypsy subclass n=1 Tax=Tanacetum cinerariifolium TaxID=118510 RepID=A0A699H3M5_TANCI|nr:retrotransposon protein, putative, Ty3-gypsy subclass [Tanacetum cinerariifolium]
MRALTSVSSSFDDTSSLSQSCDSVMRPLFLLENELGAQALELRRDSLSLTLLYLASKSLVFLISGPEELMLKELQHLKLNYFSLSNLGDFMFKSIEGLKGSGTEPNRLVLELLKKEKLYAKFSKCEFWLQEVQFRGHVINGDGIHVDPSNIEVFKNWKALRTSSEVRSFLGLSRYYHRFIEDFSKIAKPLTVLTQKTLPDGLEDFIVYCDAFGLGIGCVLMQRELFSYYDCESCYHPGKVNVVADALSRKERVKPKRVRDVKMTLSSSIKDRILVAQKEAPDDVRTLIIDEAHKSKYSVHPGADKMYYDLRDRHDVPISIISDHDSQFTSRFWQLMQEALGTRLDMSTAYHPQTDGQSERTIQTLEDMLKACAEVGEGQLIGPELVQETTKKISQIKDRIKAA